MRRQQQPLPGPEPKSIDKIEPKKPDVAKPIFDPIKNRMKKVDPELAKKYRQRSGE